MAQTSILAQRASVQEALRQCLQDLATVVAGIESRDVLVTVQYQLDRLKLWAGSMGVFAPGRASADHRLRDDADTRSVIMGILRQIARKALQHEFRSRGQGGGPDAVLVVDNTNGEPPDIHPLDDDNDASIESGSDSLDESDSDSTKAVSASTETWIGAITRSIDSLFLLASTIRKPIRYQGNSRILQFTSISATDSEQLEDLVNHVRFQLKGKYEAQNIEPDRLPSEALVARLANAARFRLQRFMYKQRHSRKLHQGTYAEFDAVMPAHLRPDRLPLHPSRDTNDAQTKNQTPTDLRAGPTSIVMSTTVASSIMPKPSAVIPKPASSVASQSAILRHDKLDFPRAPKIGGGQTGTCPYCCLTLDSSMSASKNWRRHILHDLEPYVCVFEDCEDGNRLYSSLDDCMQHMQWRHGAVWVCNARGHEDNIYPSSSDLENHLKQDHAAALSEIQIQRIVEKGIRPSNKAFGTCPICLEPIDEPLKGTDASDVKLNVTKRFRGHVAKHLEFIALLSLPPQPEENENEDSNLKQQESMNVSSTSASSSQASAVSSLPDVPDVPDLEGNEHPPALYWLGQDVFPRPEEDPTLQTFVTRSNSRKPLSDDDNSFLDEECSIGIVCALKTEYEDMVAMFDHVYYRDELLPKDDWFDITVSVHHGRIATHGVAIAYQPPKAHFQSNPRATVECVLKRFTRIQFILSVGVGSAIPDPDGTPDIRLGDIVVGASVLRLMKNGGVIELRYVEGPRGAIWENQQAPYNIPDCVQSVLNAMATQRTHVSARTATHMARAREQDPPSGTNYPDHDTDILFRVGSRGGETRIVVKTKHLRSDREDRLPRVFCGTVASLEVGLADGYVRDYLGRETGAICVETEGHGMYAQLPRLTVRGICDYVDGFDGSNIAEDWGSYAAFTAAAFTKELIAQIPAGADLSRVTKKKGDVSVTRFRTAEQRSSSFERQIQGSDFADRLQDAVSRGCEQDARVFVSQTGESDDQEELLSLTLQAASINGYYQVVKLVQDHLDSIPI